MRDTRAKRDGRWLRTIAFCAVTLTLSPLAFAAPAQASTPACFGAPSRAYQPCRNPALRLLVSPTPSEAPLTTNTPCSPVRAKINLCAFGAPAGHPRATIALIGDSHAWHWRPAVDVLARALHWRGLSSTRSSCPFSEGTTLLPEPFRVGCTDWTASVIEWFEENPQVSVVFTSDHPARVMPYAGHAGLGAQVAGIVAAWRALPPTVKHIIVLRDVPIFRASTFPCVEAAMESHQEAGRACALPRDQALFQDPNVLAAEQVRHRVQVIDMTRFFCDWHLCYPVVGGALVYRNADHMTRAFAQSLGPYVLYALERLMHSSWRR